MRKRISNIHESTRRFNVASRKNAQRTLSIYDPNEPQPGGAIWNSTDHVIQGPSTEHEHAEVEFCGIVIPNGNGKKFPKYYLQPTSENAFQHGKIEELVE